MKLNRLILLFILSSCDKSSKQPDEVKPHKPNAERQEQLKFLERTSTIEDVLGMTFPCFANKCLTNLHQKSIPPTTYLANYNTGAFTNMPHLLVCFPGEFLPNVPVKILEHLRENNVPFEHISLCLNVQDNDTFGRVAPDTGFTRLKAHGWAAPDAPPDDQLKGDVVNRSFLHAIYEADDPSIENQDVKLNKLLSFPVHVHQTSPHAAPISPPGMAKIAITKDSPSQSFWSLVIDDKHPADQPLRASITLHWILKWEETTSPSKWGQGFRSEFAKYSWKKLRQKSVPFKEMVADFKNNKILAQHQIMQSLKKLLGNVWDEIK